MNNFFFHYLSYLDGLSVAVKSLILAEKSLPGYLYNTCDNKKLFEFFMQHGVSEKEAHYAACKISLTELKKRAREDYTKLEDIRFIDYYHNEYPYKLKNIYNPPLGIYVRGKLPDKQIPCVAVIGARECSDYGVKYTRLYTDKLCQNNIQIISGMARGIDGIAGRTSVAYKDLSFAVLGSGINCPYPECNKDLYEALLQNGSLISEYPPDTKAQPFRFPYRNRIISGLSDCVFVAEAAVKSGSHITAYFALEQGKDVFALPGPVDSKLSEGTNILIKNGAYPALSVDDILHCLKIVY